MIHAHFFFQIQLTHTFLLQKWFEHTFLSQKQFTHTFCRENDLRTSSGKFLRVDSCHPESLDFLGLWGTVTLFAKSQQSFRLWKWAGEVKRHCLEILLWNSLPVFTSVADDVVRLQQSAVRHRHLEVFIRWVVIFYQRSCLWREVDNTVKTWRDAWGHSASKVCCSSR